MSIRAHAARLDLGARVTLFDIDLTSLGGDIRRFAPMTQVLGAKGYTRIAINGSVSSRGRSWLFPANTARAWYVRMVLRKETHQQYFSIYGFGSGALTTAKAFDSNHAKNLAGQNRSGASAGMGVIQHVQTLAQGDYVIIGASLVVQDNNWLDRFYLHPQGGTWSLANWTTNNAFFANPKLDLVSIEFWQETSLNNLQNEGSDLETSDADRVTGTQFPTDEVIAPLVWRGNEYTPLPIRAEGFDMVGNGAYPRPKITMSNALGLGTTLTKQYADLLGAQVTRWRTFSRFLDDGISPDPNAHLPVDIYKVDMKSSHTKHEIEWELASVLDQQGILLPGRQVLRHGCQLQYRTYSGGSFNYQNVSCPYTGMAYFNEFNEPVTDPAQDRCSQQLNGCLRRFTGRQVPFGGFPMVGRISR